MLLLQGSGGYGINLGSRTTNMIIHGDEHIRIYSPSKKQQIQRVPNDSDYAASRDDMKDDQSPIPSGRRFCSGACFRIFVCVSIDTIKIFLPSSYIYYFASWTLFSTSSRQRRDNFCH